MESCRRINCFYLYIEEIPASVVYKSNWELRAFDFMGCPQRQESGPCVDVLVEIHL